VSCFAIGLSPLLAFSWSIDLANNHGSGKPDFAEGQAVVENVPPSCLALKPEDREEIRRLPNAAFGPMLALMNNKGPILVLLLVAVGLGIALIVVNKEAADQAKDAAYNLTVSSNTLVLDKKRLDELQTVNQMLET